jgi:hypothetical protein
MDISEKKILLPIIQCIVGEADISSHPHMLTFLSSCCNYTYLASEVLLLNWSITANSLKASK